MLIHKIAHSVASVYRKVRLSGLGTTDSWQRTYNGMYMRVKPDDFMDQAMLFGYYEAGLVHWIENVVQAGDVVVDIGAHKGYVSLLLAKVVGDRGKVISVEPDTTAFTILSTNVQYNNLSNVSLFSCLVGDKPGRSDFYLSHQLGFSSRFPNEVAAPLVSSKVEIEVKTLDALLENERNISFVKIDAEGSEPLILAGMQRTLSVSSPIVWLEVNLMSLKSAGHKSGAIEDLFRSFSYEVYKTVWRRDGFLRGYLSLIPVSEFDQTIDCFDIVAIPSSFDLHRVLSTSRIHVER